MQSNLIIKNTVKQRSLYLYLQLIIMYKQNQTIHQKMGLMSLEGALNKVCHIDIFLQVQVLFPEI